ncbi:hypothetical protein CHS0354_024739 [Potamilus streckersoni]|uniref:B box-type domain-containing protein n=1 Tax=Potamilus streckersoni TaxID=2493646 RepID=A0AAE0RX36_9BIVA|nr:hypothetical protein CHS0354_024739 [Potamilus streckersoni]
MEESTPHRDVNNTKQKYGNIDADDVEFCTFSVMETNMDDTKECNQNDKTGENYKSDDITYITTTNTNHNDSNVHLRDDPGDTIQLESMSSEVFTTDNKTLESEHRSSETLDEKCQKHPGKKLEYVCNDHEEIICILCKDKNHNMCKSQGCISDLEDVYKAECRGYLDKSKKTKDEIEAILSDKKIEYDETKCSIEKCRSDIINNKLTQSIKSNEDQLCKRLLEIESKIEAEHSENVKILERTLSGINSFVGKINNSQSTVSYVAAALVVGRCLKNTRNLLSIQKIN